MNKERELHHCMGSTLRDLNWEPCPDLMGFILRDSISKQAFFTVYVAERGYSAYIAINDPWKGMELVDEKPIILNAPLFACVSSIKAEHMKMCPDAYRDAPPVNSNPQRAPHYLAAS